MIEATDAKSKAQVVLGIRFAGVLDFAQDKIEAAVTDGKMTVTYTTNHDVETRRYLKDTLQDLGYKVTYSSQFGDESVNIDWSVPFQR